MSVTGDRRNPVIDALATDEFRVSWKEVVGELGKVTGGCDIIVDL